MPALLCGDFNGDYASPVVQFLRGYGWQCAYTSHAGRRHAADAAPTAPAAPAAPAARGRADDAAPAESAPRWISHHTHERRSVGVDFIFLRNPSPRRPPVPDWTDVVFSEMAEQVRTYE